MMTLQEFIEEHYGEKKELNVRYEQYMREHDPAVKEAWEKYQTILNLKFNTNNEEFIEHEKQQKIKANDREMELLSSMMRFEG